MKSTLILIVAFLTFMIGSFIWFVATWDRDAEEPITFIERGHLPPQDGFMMSEKRSTPLSGLVQNGQFPT